MDVVIFELRPANKRCGYDFRAIAEASKTKLSDKNIFESACDYANASASYKRNGRHLNILEVSSEYIKIKLQSETRLEMASKALAGFSRELCRLDEVLNPAESRYFTGISYGNALFRNVQISETEDPQDAQLKTDAEILKRCVDIFCTSATTGKDQLIALNKVKAEIVKAISAYDIECRALEYERRS